MLYSNLAVAAETMTPLENNFTLFKGLKKLNEVQGHVILGCLLHREGSTGQFAGVRVQEGKLQAAQSGQANLVLDADYLHQFLLLSTTDKKTDDEN